MRGKLGILLLAALMLLSGCGGEDVPAVPADPYQGMVQVATGFGTEMWVELYEDVPLNTLSASADFVREKGWVSYTGSEVETRRGIDVSEHQGVIDWAAVAAEGIDFAIIRAGYRGYSEGGLFEDACFQENMNGAVENHIPVGLYFFSQATSVEEAVEEAEFLAGRISRYAPEAFTLPIFYDWETIGVENARTDNVPAGTVTACAKAFCDTLSAAGYTPGVYAYRYLGYFTYDLPELRDYPLWMGAVGDSPDFFYRHDIWQYSIEGRVDGIQGDVDLNLMFLWDESGEGYGAVLAYLPADSSGHFVPMETADSNELLTLLNGGEWTEGEKCGCEGYVILQSGEKVLHYCGDCGQFYDDGRVLSLDKKTRKNVNALWEEYFE